MSLKAFHVFFVIVSLICTVGFGIWGVRSYQNAGEVADLFMGIGSFVVTIALLIYFRWFLRKLKNESYL